MWKLDLDDNYYRIFDSSKMIAGYFDPDFGNIFPQNKEEELISQMIKKKDKVPGGFLMVPLVKFGLFDSDLETDISYLDSQIAMISQRINKWKEFLDKTKIEFHIVRISHTDQDMLTITFPLRFSNPTPLDEKLLIKEIEPTLDLLQKSGLL